MNYLDILTREIRPDQFGAAQSGTGADPKLLAAAMHRQVAAAVARSPLDDYRKAADQQHFVSAPTSMAEAYQKTAYWTAVAARCSGVWTLADLADKAQRASNDVSYADRAKDEYRRRMNVLWSSTVVDPVDANRIAAVMRPYADAILAAAPTNPGAKSAAAALGSIADPSKISSQQEVQRGQSGVAQVADAAAETAQNPGGSEESPTDWWRIAKYAGAAVAVAGGVYFLGPAVRGASVLAGSGMETAGAGSDIARRGIQDADRYRRRSRDDGDEE